MPVSDCSAALPGKHHGLTICRSLGHSFSAEETIAALSHQLDQTYRAVAANLPTNPAARVETSDGKDELVLTGLDKLDDPPNLVRLREAVNARLPRVDLPEILLEIAARTEFTSKFTHVSEHESRVGDLATSLCAVLIAEACNRGNRRDAAIGRNKMVGLDFRFLIWTWQFLIESASADR